jgi:hypothetical protein
VTGTLKQDVEEFLMTTYEQLKQEGRLEGANLVLAQLVAKKFHTQSDELLPLLGNLSAAQQEELIQRVLESSSLQDVKDWLNATGNN